MIEGGVERFGGDSQLSKKENGVLKKLEALS